MSRYEYKNETHFFYVCRKILFNNGLKLSYDDQQRLQEITDSIYKFQKTYDDLLYKLELREVTKIFSYMLRSVYDFDELAETLEDFAFIFKRFSEIVKDENVNRENYRDLYDEYYRPIIVREQVWFKKEKKYKQFTDEFIELQKELARDHGVYFLYDENQALIYIGKSVMDLGSRIASSAAERQATFVRYALTKTKSDTAIYEMYYISKFKPPLNNDGKCDDETTIVLPELTFSKIYRIYEDVKDEVKQDGQIQTCAC